MPANIIIPSRSRAASNNLAHRGHPSGRLGAVINILLVTLVVGLISTLAITTVPKRRNPPPPPPPAPMTNSELEVALRRNQITPETLAAAGFSANDLTALIGRARTHLSDNIQALRDAQRGFADARREVDRLTRLVRSGLGGAQAAADLATAQTALASTRNALDTRLTAIKAAGLSDSVSAAAATTLATIAANSAWDVPVAYRCRADATEPQWIELREALADQQISQRDGSELSPQAQRVLAQWHADPNVAAARTNLDSLQTTSLQAWNTAIPR